MVQQRFFTLLVSDVVQKCSNIFIAFSSVRVLNSIRKRVILIIKEEEEANYIEFNNSIIVIYRQVNLLHVSNISIMLSSSCNHEWYPLN